MSGDFTTTAAFEAFEKQHGKIDIHTDDEFVFLAACRKGDIQTINVLIALESTHGPINIHAKNEFAFITACSNGGNRSVVERLFSLEASHGKIKINASNESAFIAACGDLDHAFVAANLLADDALIARIVSLQSTHGKISPAIIGQVRQLLTSSDKTKQAFKKTLTAITQYSHASPEASTQPVPWEPTKLHGTLLAVLVIAIALTTALGYWTLLGWIVILIVIAGFIIAIEGSRELGRRYQKRYGTDKGMGWWYWCGISGVSFGPIIALSIYASRGKPVPDLVCLKLVAMVICSCLILATKSRWAWLAVTILSLNPLGWIINGIYLQRRWKMLGHNHGEDTLGKLTCASSAVILAIAVCMAVASIPNTTIYNTPSSQPAPTLYLNSPSAVQPRMAPKQQIVTTPTPATLPFIQPVWERHVAETARCDAYFIRPATLNAVRIPTKSPEIIAYNINGNQAHLTVLKTHETVQMAAVPNMILNHWQREMPDVKVKKNEYVTLANTQWIHLVVAGTETGIAHTTADQYIYSGDNGTFEIIATYPTEYSDYYSSEIDQTAATFQFAPAPNQ
jgi:hypothetical protein